jgi:hypothetical protein
VETTSQKTINRAATLVRPASARQQVQPRSLAGQGGLRIQRATKVSSPGDPAEKEADTTAQKVMRMAVSESAVAYTRTSRGGVFRQVTPEDKQEQVQAKLQSPYISRFSGSGLFKQAAPEEETVQRQAAPEKAIIQKQAAPEEEKVQPQAAPEKEMVQPQAAPEKDIVQKQAAPEEETVQRQAAPEKDMVQTQSMKEPEQVQTRLQSPYIARFAHSGLFRQSAPEEETVQRQAAPEQEMVQTQAMPEKETVQRQAAPEKDIVQKQAAPEEETVQRQAAPEKDMVQTQSTKEPEQVQTRLQSPYIACFAHSGLFRQAAPEEETVQRQAAPEKDMVQTQAMPEEETAQRQVTTEEKDTVQTQVEQQEEDTVQRKVDDRPNLAENVAADIRSSMSTGSPLPLSVRRFMEPRFQADFSQVKVHTDDNAAKLNQQVKSQAFAMGNHIFFGKDKYQPETEEGKELLAHELTHTIQQGGAAQGEDNQGEQTDTVQRSEAVSVTQHSSVQVQRLGISDALDYFADKAYNIPGFRMFTIIIGVNPINMQRADRSAANILRAIVEFLPGGNLITRALDNYGVFERAGAWIEQQLDSLGITGSSIRAAVMEFLDSLGWRDIFDLGGVWRRAKRIFTDPISRIISFIRSLGGAILQFIRDAILRPLAGLAEGTRGWPLLQAVLGFNPITGEPYPRNAETLIGGFMTLIGQQEVWENIKRANAVARAWAWFQGALSGLLGFVRSIPGRFMQVLRSLTIQDLVVLPRAFEKVGRAFLGFVGQFMSWAFSQVMNLLQIIFEVVAPGVMPFLRRARGAFQTIIRNPIGFIGNLVRAGIRGFRQFSARFLTHLRASLIGWLTGAMGSAGVYIPQGFSLPEILKFVLSVLGLTWQNIRQKLVRVVGEPAVAAMESGFELVRTLVTEGPAAAWEQLLEGLSNLQEMVMEQIMSFVQSQVVQKAIQMLVSSLSPAGAFVQAIIAIYNTVMFFVERLRQIAQVGMAFVNSIAAIASGAIGAAANRVEQTMAGMLTLVISFLARLAGLGRVSDIITNLINRVREPIDRGLDRVVAWIVRQARRLGRFVAQAGVPQDPNERLRLGKQAALTAVNRFAGRRVGHAVLSPLLAGIKVRYGFTSLDLTSEQGKWHLLGSINPNFKDVTEVLTPDSLVPSEEGRTLLVGEGNFTFALSIAIKTKIGDRLVATDFVVEERKALKSSQNEARNSPEFQENTDKLRNMGVQVERQVNATDPRSYPSGSFEIIVFNHPLVLSRQQGRTLRGGERANIELIRGFLSAAKSRITASGQIMIISSLYRLQRWKLDEIARELDLEQRVVSFVASNFPEYMHERTEQRGGASTVQTREQFAIIFSINANTST